MGVADRDVAVKRLTDRLVWLLIEACRGATIGHRRLDVEQVGSQAVRPVLAPRIKCRRMRIPCLTFLGEV